MRYLFINSVAGFGSTGRIAAGKCRELMKQGHQCVLAYGRNKANCDDVPTVAIGSPLNNKLHGVKTRLLDGHGFGSRGATMRFLKWVRQYDPDVIWLHNIHGYYIHIGLLFDYLRSSGKKVIWTLHDCWAFTGHCAHFDFAGCDKWKTGCHHCPQKGEYPASCLLDSSRKNYERKRRLFTGLPDLTLTAPSQWLADLVKKSFLKEYPVEVIYNTINLDIFKPTPGDFRSRHDLLDSVMVLGVASIWGQRKGLQDFIAMAEKLKEPYRIVMVGLTPEQIQQMPENVICIERTNSPEELAQIYTAADVFVNPTYEDTYPTVNLEARACGTKIISYDTGGCRETMGQGDVLVSRGDVDGLIRAIMDREEEAR